MFEANFKPPRIYRSWQDINKRLPEIGIDILVLQDVAETGGGFTKEPLVAQFRGMSKYRGQWSWVSHQGEFTPNVTHWMSIPPFKEKKRRVKRAKST